MLAHCQKMFKIFTFNMYISIDYIEQINLLIWLFEFFYKELS